MIYLGAAACCGLIMLAYCIRSKRFLPCLCFSSVSGLSALGVMHVLGMFSAALLNFNLFTGLVSVILGIPGVLLMMILKLIWRA